MNKLFDIYSNDLYIKTRAIETINKRYLAIMTTVRNPMIKAEVIKLINIKYLPVLINKNDLYFIRIEVAKRIDHKCLKDMTYDRDYEVRHIAYKRLRELEEPPCKILRSA